MDKVYNPNDIEQKQYAIWEAAGYFTPQDNAENYCIVLPPPNITGSLHMGHGFQCTVMDILIRYHRMLGKSVLWQAGTDHAGIATQMVVERLLAAENISRQELGRTQFVERIWEWKNHSGNRITQQLRRLGASLDWQRERFTLDQELSYAVREVFIRLYREGLIYKKQHLVNWDPSLATAISDLEVIVQEEQGVLYYINYPVVATAEYLTIATTRPETLFGDVAVAVNPQDSRYQHLIGQSLRLPLTEKIIPIIADDYVDPDFGSGCLKITPAHDFNDYQIGLKHNLSMVNIFTPAATLNQNVPLQYQGLERHQARKIVVDALQQQGLLLKATPHNLHIPYGEKSGCIIEPYLTEQWFVKMQPLAQPAIDVVMHGKIRFFPENWTKVYLQWLHNIQDWCISRQLWWGHRIPVWYDQAGKIYVGHDEKDIYAHYQIDATTTLTQEDDVLDTWFSSALWPFSALGWPKDTLELSKFFPTQVLVTGFDIIFFWVARMVMMSLKFTGSIPFSEVYITGLIRDASGQKMSKSKGNVLDPLDLIDGISLPELINKRTYGLMQPDMANKIIQNTQMQFPDGIKAYGTDALRMTFASLAAYAKEIRFDLNKLAHYRNFCNKLWNAARFVVLHATEQEYSAPVVELAASNASNSWIISELNHTIKNVTTALSSYRFDVLVNDLYEFTWGEFCNWYLEITKFYFNNPLTTPADKKHMQHTLLYVLEILLRLLHPVMPFITAEIWLKIAPLLGQSSASIMIAPYPTYTATLLNDQAGHEFSWLKNIVTAIRTMRSTLNIPPAQVVTLCVKGDIGANQTLLTQYGALMSKLANVNIMQVAENRNTTAEPAQYAASTVFNGLELDLHVSNTINIAEELSNIARQIAKLEAQQIKLSAKLSNADFKLRAPQQIIQQTMDDLSEIQQKIQQQRTQQSKLLHFLKSES